MSDSRDCEESSTPCDILDTATKVGSSQHTKLDFLFKSVNYFLLT